jgi:non-ribosomal peptide synthetase component F
MGQTREPDRFGFGSSYLSLLTEYKSPLFLYTFTVPFSPLHSFRHTHSRYNTHMGFLMQPSPTAPLAHLTSTDRALFYQHGIGPSRSVQIPVIHHSFEHHARIQPDAIAVEDVPSNSSITFAELDRCSDRLAHVLRAKNIRPGTRVCILARRSIPLVAGILATLKSGGQYVPLDALTITDDTLKFVLEDASPTLVLCMEEFAHRLAETQIPVVSLEPTLSREQEANPLPIKVEDFSTPEDGAYCIYTSGTTGEPPLATCVVVLLKTPLQAGQRESMSGTKV